MPPIAGFSERELDVLGVLWDAGPATAAEARDALAARGLDLAYNTVLTVLRILEDKGHVGHTVEGRAHRYHALVAREDAGRSALGRLVRTLFQSSPELLLTHLVRDRSVTPETVRRLRDLLDAELDAGPSAERAGEGSPTADAPDASDAPDTPDTPDTPDAPPTAARRPRHGRPT